MTNIIEEVQLDYCDVMIKPKDPLLIQEVNQIFIEHIR